MKRLAFWFILAVLSGPGLLYGQALPTVFGVEAQPLLAQAVWLNEALSFLGNPLADEDTAQLQALQDQALTSATTGRIQDILDPYCLVMVDINAEGRVKVVRGSAKAVLIEKGWTSFLVKIHNQAGVTARLEVESPNADPLLHRSTGAPHMQEQNVLTPGQVANRFLEVALYRNRPLHTGLAMAVVKGDEVVYLNGFGEADREAGVEATAETLFYIASLTKSFTALAAALLDARGDLDLDASLAHYLPTVDFNPAIKADSVTLRHLITHTAGLHNGGLVFRTAFSGEHTPEVLIDVMDKTTKSQTPLGTFSYTNLGYNILSIILDRETGQPWQDLLRDMIFEPLGMTRTTAYASLPRQEGWPVAAPYFGLHPDGIERAYLEKQDNTMFERTE